MPKVLRIINRFNLGGPTYNAANLTRDLSPEYETLLVGGKHEHEEASSEYILEKMGLDFQIIPSMQRGLDKKNDREAYKHLLRIIDEFQPDIVHTHASKAGALGRMAAIRRKVPVIVHTFHGHVFHGYFGNLKTRFYKGVERYLSRKSDAIIAISPIQKEQLVNEHRVCKEDQTHVVPLGFDLDRFVVNSESHRSSFRSNYGIDQDEFVVGIVGRFAPIKNHELFLESIAIANKKATRPIKAVLVGDGNRKEELVSMSQDLSIADQLIWTSWIEQIEEALPAFDAVVLTSKNEGTPVRLIEAQASGVPVISTDVGGVRDVILDEESGFVVNQTAQEIADSIVHLETIGADLRKRMGDLGREHVLKNYGAERLAADVHRLYDQLLQKR
ncbi:MAG: glycosyltransferase [Flavobacteriales bacterium]|nr:glycosyltransferase [Flavobacteriales bacterium]